MPLGSGNGDAVNRAFAYGFTVDCVFAKFLLGVIRAADVLHAKTVGREDFMHLPGSGLLGFRAEREVEVFIVDLHLPLHLLYLLYLLYLRL